MRWAGRASTPTSGYPRFEDVERDFLLQILDTQWKDHLHTMDGLREAIGLRGYASRDPKLEYQREGLRSSRRWNTRIDSQALEIAYKVQLRDPGDTPVPARRCSGAGRARRGARGRPRRPCVPAPGGLREAAGQAGQGGSNDPCPCGSGKKYKKCHGA